MTSPEERQIAPEAAMEELPPILAAPPWRRKNKKTKFKSFDLPLLPCADVNALPDDVRLKWRLMQKYEMKYWFLPQRAKTLEEVLRKCFIFSSDKPLDSIIDNCLAAVEKNDPETLTDLWLNALRKHDPGTYSLHLKILNQLPHNLALAVWNATATLYDSTVYLEYFMAEHGLAAKKGLVEIFDKKPISYEHIAAYWGCPEMAWTYARIFSGKSQNVGSARRWFLNYPEQALCGLLPLALKADKQPNKIAQKVVRFLAKSQRTLVLEIAGRYQDPELTRAVTALIDADPLDDFPAKIPPVPAAWDPAAWARPILKQGPGQGRALSPEALPPLVQMLAFPTVGGLYEGLEQTREWCTGESLAEFVWDMFLEWESKTKALGDRFGFTSLAVFGNDLTARRLLPFILRWPGKSLKARSVLALDILEEMGTEAAWGILNILAYKRNLKDIPKLALEKLEKIAQEQNLSLESLRERLIPTLELDQNSGLDLDFGPRQFRVSLDKQLKPLIQDAQGKFLKSFPRAGQGDDPLKAKQAADTFASLRKEVQTIVDQQSRVFNQAMIRKRFWDFESFERYFVPHPVVRFLVQGLVWGIYENQGAPKLIRSFRVDENFSFADSRDDSMAADELRQGLIGLPHPLELSAEDIAAYNQIFTDYELIQPFPQIDRETFALSAAEAGQSVLERWHGKAVPAGKLQALYWRSVNSWRGGADYYVDSIYQQLDHGGSGGGHLAFLAFRPGFDGYTGSDKDAEQTLEKVTLTTGSGGPDSTTFGELDPILVSEMLRDLESL